MLSNDCIRVGDVWCRRLVSWVWSSICEKIVSGLQAHCAPLQAPPLEYQCTSCGNSSRTAIIKKKEKTAYPAAERQDAAADLCRTRQHLHGKSHTHHTTARIFISMCPILVFPCRRIPGSTDVSSALTAAKYLLLQKDKDTHFNTYTVKHQHNTLKYPISSESPAFTVEVQIYCIILKMCPQIPINCTPPIHTENKPVYKGIFSLQLSIMYIPRNSQCGAACGLSC